VILKILSLASVIVITLQDSQLPPDAVTLRVLTAVTRTIDVSGPCEPVTVTTLLETSVLLVGLSRLSQ
jgi:hypothetical protein